MTWNELGVWTGPPRTWRDSMAYRREVTGILLRYGILVVMRGVTVPSSVAEIVDSVEQLGVDVPERKGKWVSDALRTEVRKDRIRRLGPDRYIGGDIPRSTWYRARRSIEDHRLRVEGTFWGDPG